MQALQPRGLARRYAWLIGSIATALILVSGLSEMYFGYREAREHISRLQAAQAMAAAREIEQYLKTLTAGIADAAKLPWGQEPFGLQARRQEFQRLMVLHPAILELQSVDRTGREQLFVSRSQPDRLFSQQQTAFMAAPQEGRPASVGFEQPFFRGASEPTMLLTVPDRGPGGALTVAAVNLRFLTDVSGGLAGIGDGRVFVIDAANRLIAHPVATHVSRSLDMTDFPPVRLLRDRAGATRDASGALDAEDLGGAAVIASAARVEMTDWLVVVEVPRAVALAPAMSTLQRTLLLMSLGLALALFASLRLAARMATPIVKLRQAASRIAQGDLGSRLQVQSGDEIEMLAQDFNVMAAELEASYAGLETKVEDRTRALSRANEQLGEQAGELARLNTQLIANMEELRLRTEEAERANAAKTRFLAAASHDLRQPMHTVGLLTGVLRLRLDRPELAGLADKVLASVAVMEGLFSSLLDISKLDAGVIRPELQNIPLRPMLERVETAYGPQAREAGLALRVRPCDAVVRTDALMLERVLGNLVSNAIRYTTRGGVLLGCRRRGQALAIQVFDTGIGIAAEHQEQVFEEFYRVGGGRAARAEGLGLGLSIVKRSAAMLGHGLRMRSTPARGSMFEICVPLVSLHSSMALANAAAPVGGYDLHGVFVLVIDDHPHNREALGDVFGQWNAQALCSASADEALAQLGQHLRTPDLIVADYQLANGQDGLAAIEQVRAAVEECVPAILLTGTLDSVDPALLRATQAIVAMSKPTDAGRLLRGVDEVIRRAIDPVAEPPAAAGSP
ncbi:hypothetical protein ASD35_17495 [Pelomonas sp. Root1444]|nr:hypothetical protein ASD35_17495 [Pelomonas sp. Root1444]